MTDADATAQRGPGWIRRLWAACRAHPKLLTGVIAAVIGGALAEVAAPLAAKQALDSARVGDTRAIGAIAIVLVLLAAARFAAAYGRRWMAGRLALDVQHGLRVSLLTALHRYDGPGQDSLRTGQVVSRSITDLQLVQGLLAMAPLSAASLLIFVLAAAVMLVLSPLLAVVALLTVPALGVVVYRTRPLLHAATWSAQQRAADLAQHVEETVTGVRVVKGFGQEGRMVHLLEGHGRRLYSERMRAARIDSRFAPTVAAIPQIGMVVVIALGGTLALRGVIGVGTFLAFAAYVTMLASSTRIVSNVIVMAQLTRAAAERVFQVIDSAPAETDPPDPQPLPDGPLGIEMRSVTFGFDPDRPVLRDFDLSVRPGETVAIIGPAGSGKSTLALLLPRLFAPDSGRIALRSNESEVDIADARAADLRAAVSVVFDEPFLFSDTVAANIALGHPDATPDEIRRAAELAAADGFIGELPDGYDTMVGERGLTLSGGQRQRLALARALLADPRILILDDATSAVDAVTEAAIFDTLPNDNGRTTLILAHRESTLAHADRIIRLTPTNSTDDPGPLWPEPNETTSTTIDSGQEHAGNAGGDAAREPARNAGSDTAQERARVRKRVPGADGNGVGAESGNFGDGDVPPEIRGDLARLPAATEIPGLDDRGLERPEPNFKLVRLLKPVRWLLLAVVTMLAADAVIAVAFPALTRYALDDGVAAGSARVLAVAAIGGAVLVLLSWVVEAGGTLLSARGGERVLYGLRVRSYAHLQRLGLDYYERELSGRIMTRMTTDIDALSTFLQTGLGNALISIGTAGGIAVALLIIDPRLAAVVFATLPPLIGATLIFRRVSAAAYSASRERVATVNADFQENVAGLRATQAYRHEPHAAQRFTGYSDAYRRARMRAQRAIALYFAFVVAWADLALAAVVYVGAREVAHGTTTAGTLVAFVLYLGLLFSPIMQLSQVFDGYQQARVGLRRIEALLRTPSSIAPDPADAADVPERMRADVAFDDVSFRYQDAKSPALEKVSLRIPAGTTLALVGETGAGKSTIVKLLARLYDLPHSDAGRDIAGAIRVDGVDVRDYRLADYRARLGVVPQEAHLFTGDVASNIAFGKPFATRAQIERAAATVGALDMIATLPRGMGQPVGEGGRGLSAGQRQLVALARAELVDPDLLLLDEATAVLDPDSEEKVLAASSSLVRAGTGQGRTAVIVAHRLATAARADRIAVVDRGRIAEIGTHDQLVEAGGIYSRLWSVARSEVGIFSTPDGSSHMRLGLSGSR
ncbi:ABC transporter ATP-binding protein [Nocardia mexicana]|uniref:ATP-binding cassette subfamily B protein n=1 Tax=Nocardia mexicana TaxID=279262 RepID=A0A370H8X4_9NOCA|nr:ABC transporter ATP-binding protein [Nocardia mexicana]RDI53101.1 ATP-binding cassette subfamily B protein [Nocardia mexicana]